MGERLAPITNVVQKNLLPISCKPIIHYSIEEGLKAGIDEFIFVVSNNSMIKVIKSYIDSISEFNSLSQSVQRVKFAIQHHAMGLGHAILCARDFIQQERFAVLLPDEIFITANGEGLLVSLISLGMQNADANIIAVCNVDIVEVHKYGIVELQQGAKNKSCSKISGMVEKPRAENAPSTTSIIGRYILQPDIFHYLQYAALGTSRDIMPQFPRYNDNSNNMEYNSMLHNSTLHNNMLPQNSKNIATHIDNTKRKEIDLTSAMQEMLMDGSEFYAFHGNGIRLDCGSILGLLEANIVIGLQDGAMRNTILDMMQRIIAQQKR